MTESKFDRYFESVMPLVAVIAMLKTFLAEEVGERSIRSVQQTRKKALRNEQKTAVRKAADAAVAKLNPDHFNIPVDWCPKSEDEVRRKLIELKDEEFKQRLIDEIVRAFTEPQRKL
jgi:hypothetical protein